RLAHQVQQDRLLRLLVAQARLQVDVLATHILAGDLELRRFAKLAQRAQGVRIARRGDGDRLVVAIPERARFDLDAHRRVLDDLLIAACLQDRVARRLVGLTACRALVGRRGRHITGRALSEAAADATVWA